MRVKEMHLLCCISLESAGIGDQSSEAVTLLRTGSARPTEILPCGSNYNAGGHMAAGSDASFAGVLYKWTNYGKEWRSRWFVLRNGILSYSKVFRPARDNDVRLIGDAKLIRN